MYVWLSYLIKLLKGCQTPCFGENNFVFNFFFYNTILFFLLNI